MAGPAPHQAFGRRISSASIHSAWLTFTDESMPGMTRSLIRRPWLDFHGQPSAQPLLLHVSCCDSPPALQDLVLERPGLFRSFVKKEATHWGPVVAKSGMKAK